ncbi:MAG: fibronectin type III domain-containing protein [Alistipes sp.]|nr:fibronectin type III domain-containing protein [Alistipes sp.]
MKKFFSLMAAVAVMFTFAACEPTPDEGVGGKLATPVIEVVDVTETGFTVQWGVVDHAESYSVVIKGDIKNVTETAIVLENLNKGEYTVRVKAIAKEGSNWEDSDFATVAQSVTGLTSVDWFEQKLYTDTYVDEETGEACYPYNSLFVDYKGEGVASLSVGLFPTDQVQAATDADILASLELWDEICVDVNSAEGASFYYSGLNGGVSYTLCTLVVNEEGLEFLAKTECSTEVAEASDAAKVWLGSWNVTSHETITFDDQGNTTFGEAEDTFTINVVASPNDPNELVIDGFSLLGEGWPVRGMVDEEGNLNIMNGDILGISEEGYYYIWLAYFLLDGYDEGQFLSDPIPTYVFKMDDAGAVTCEMFTTEAELQDGTKINIVAAHTEIYGLNPNNGELYFLIENFPAVFRANEFDMTKAAATAAKRMMKGQSRRKAAPAIESNVTISSVVRVK